MPTTSKNGNIKFDSGEIADVTNITFTESVEAKEYTSSDTGGYVKVAEGNKRASGQFEILLDTIATPVAIGTVGNLQQYATAASSRTFEVMITEIAVGVNIAGADFIGATISWIANGDFS